MNYRHDFHAGNFADVFKHVVLVRILLYLQRKPAPYRVIDTHAGSGRYDLAADAPIRTGEWRNGIGRLDPATLGRDLRPALLRRPPRRRRSRLCLRGWTPLLRWSGGWRRTVVRPTTPLTASALRPMRCGRRLGFLRRMSVAGRAAPTACGSHTQSDSQLSRSDGIHRRTKLTSPPLSLRAANRLGDAGTRGSPHSG